LSKIIGLKGKKRVEIPSSAKRGTTTTVVFAAMQRDSMLLLYRFSKSKRKLDLLNGAHPKTVMVCYSSGWMQTNILPRLVQLLS
jgi:hypothetical protein